MLVFILVIACVAGWWLSQQRIMSKPWLEQGAGVELEGSSLPTAKIGLGVFLAVVGALFALFASAYFMRMEYADWRTMPLPDLLLVNTIMLVLSSAALQCAVIGARDDSMNAVRIGLVAGGVSAVAFLIGQLLAWRELTASGYFLTGNPANSFFYLLTAMHGLHILGGLVALSRTTAGAWGGAGPADLRLRVELCAMYWHFLLFVWIGLLVLFRGWAYQFIFICRQLLT
ncbi:MAG: cytochrome c oxidase subunit 3 [Pseudomonadota bacterium]